MVAATKPPRRAACPAPRISTASTQTPTVAWAECVSCKPPQQSSAECTLRVGQALVIRMFEFRLRWQSRLRRDRHDGLRMTHAHLTFRPRICIGLAHRSMLIAWTGAVALLGCGKERPFAKGESSLRPERETPSATVGDASVPNPAAAADCTEVGCPRPLTCDPKSRRCVECLTSASCVSADAPVCDAETHACVRCIANTDCPSTTQTCRLAESEREANRCVECTSDSECPDAQPACDPNTDECTARCTTSTQCNPPTPVCNERTQTCVGCLDDRDCVNEPGLGGSCRPDDARCVECLSDAQCVGDPAASNCSSGGTCVSCTADEDCSLIQGRSACLTNIGCVECVDGSECVGNAAGPICATSNVGVAAGSAAANTCVECVENADCVNSSASLCENNQCVPCSANADCAHVDSTPDATQPSPLGICDAGTCVECTGLQRAACGANVCDSLTRQCSADRLVATAGLCESCVSDAECEPGSLCVQQTGVGFFCMPVQPNTGCPTSGPARGFLQQASVLTIDGVPSPVCLPRLAACPAFVNYRDGTLCAGIDDESCGPSGSCEQSPGGGAFFLCTISCAGISDCLRGMCIDDSCTL
jgi:hypothetical protein